MALIILLTLPQTYVSQKLSAVDDFDDFNNNTESRVSQPNVIVADYFNDKINSRSDDFMNKAKRKEIQCHHFLMTLMILITAQKTQR